MFVLSSLSHILRLPPDLLNLPLEVSIRCQLEKLFVDKVIAKLGLCVSVYDLRKIKGGFIDAGRGAPTYEVEFRVVVFRPFVGEVISAKLKHQDETGLVLTLGFFDDIYVPAAYMQQPSTYKLDSATNQNLWFWLSDYGEFVIDGDEEIRFQVQSVNYPPLPLEVPENSKPFAPMVVTGSICGDGLGLFSWWVDENEEEEEEQ
uniref:DNA-directed RNA polymerase subunit n=1 Tax=Kalanchoe fedtschenkoi TaxID=63787 RepID=A0A7N0R811_KALFE